MPVDILFTAEPARHAISIDKTIEDSRNDALRAMYYLYTAFGTAAGVG